MPSPPRPSGREPIDADLLREGDAMMAAAEDGSLPPTPEAPDIPPAEAAVLLAGYDAEDIADMNPEERTSLGR